MQYHVKKFTLFLPLLMLLCLAAAPRVEAQQRLERPPAREVEGTPILAAGSQTVPEGTFLILEMENRLTSETSRQSDRFRARVASPVVDANGRVLIPEAAYVEGHVSNVTPARWGRRSGIIAIDFDNLYLPNGKRYPIRGYLTSADPDDRKRIDDEGNIKGKAPIKRDTVFIGGGAGAIPPMVGWAAATGRVDLVSVILFLIVFMWTPPHFWALAIVRKGDYARAGVPMLPVVHGEPETRRQIWLYTWALVAVTLLLPVFNLTGTIYLVSAILLGLWMIWGAWRVWKSEGNKAAWQMYRWTSMYLLFLFIAFMVDRMV